MIYKHVLWKINILQYLWAYDQYDKSQHLHSAHPSHLFLSRFCFRSLRCFTLNCFLYVFLVSLLFQIPLYSSSHWMQLSSHSGGKTRAQECWWLDIWKHLCGHRHFFFIQTCSHVLSKTSKWLADYRQRNLMPLPRGQITPVTFEMEKVFSIIDTYFSERKKEGKCWFPLSVVWFLISYIRLS